MGKDNNEASAAGRGAAFIAGAKVYFMLVGLVTELILPNVLGNAVFGAWHLVKLTVSVVNNVLIAGTIQTLSKFVAPSEKLAKNWHGAGLRMHGFIGLPLAILFIVLAPLIGWFFKDPTKVGPLMLAGTIIALYSGYAVFVGVANGQRHFHKQALLDVCFATLRSGLIIGLGAVGLGLYGVLSGWVFAAVVIVGVASVVVGRPAKPTEETPSLPMAKFLGSVALYLLLLNALMMIDTVLLKRFATDMWLTGMGGESASDFADNMVGYYGKAGNLARITYSALIAVTFVVFPLMSKATFEADRVRTASYVQGTLRYSMILGALPAIVLMANPYGIINVVYKQESATFGETALLVLAAGYLAFSIFAIGGALLNAAGETRKAIGCGLVAAIGGVVLGFVLIPSAESPLDLLKVTAASISVAMVLGAVSSLVAMRKSFGATMPIATLCRVLACAAGAVFLGQLWKTSGLVMTLVECVLVSVVYVLLLWATQEIGKQDLQEVLRLRKRQESPK